MNRDKHLKEGDFVRRLSRISGYFVAGMYLDLVDVCREQIQLQCYYRDCTSGWLWPSSNMRLNVIHKPNHTDNEENDKNKKKNIHAKHGKETSGL